MSDELNRLLELARTATPGPWFAEQRSGEHCVRNRATDGLTWSLAVMRSWDKHEENAAFIAAANPLVIQKLVAVIVAAEEMRKRLRNVDGSGAATIYFAAALSELKKALKGADR